MGYESWEANLTKRLAEAELAAEYWRQKGDPYFIPPEWAREWSAQDFPALCDEAMRKASVFERFATLPHYDKEPDAKS